MGKNMIFKREGGGGDNFSGKYLPQIVNTIVEVLLVIPWYTKLDNPIFTSISLKKSTFLIHFV